MDKVSSSGISAWIEHVVTARIAGGRPVAGIRRFRLPAIGSYDCERVTIDLQSGNELVLFLKNFSHSRLSKDQPERRRIRELRVYRDLLDGAGLGTPEYFAAMCDDSEDKYWLLLEFVEAEVLEIIDERNGVSATAWLARMQRHFLDRADDLASCDFLIEHDTEYFQKKAADASRNVGTQAAVHSAALEHALQCYVENGVRFSQHISAANTTLLLSTMRQPLFGSNCVWPTRMPQVERVSRFRTCLRCGGSSIASGCIGWSTG